MFHKITVKGEAKTDYPHLEELDGIDCQDEFSEYFHKKHGNEDYQQSLIDKGVNSGYLKFEFSNNKLYSITEYKSPEKLTEKELEILKEYTQGQWSDGIGEGFEQHPCYTASKPYQKYNPDFDDYEDQEEADEDLDVYISPWFYGQIVIITQE